MTTTTPMAPAAHDADLSPDDEGEEAATALYTLDPAAFFRVFDAIPALALDTQVALRDLVNTMVAWATEPTDEEIVRAGWDSQGLLLSYLAVDEAGEEYVEPLRAFFTGEAPWRFIAQGRVSDEILTATLDLLEHLESVAVGATWDPEDDGDEDALPPAIPGTTPWIRTLHVGLADQDEQIEIRLTQDAYTDGHLAVIGYDGDGEAWKVSVNVPGTALASGEFILNHDVPREVLPSLLAAGLVDTDRRVSYGFVRDQPVLRLPLPS